MTAIDDMVYEYSKQEEVRNTEKITSRLAMFKAMVEHHFSFEVAEEIMNGIPSKPAISNDTMVAYIVLPNASAITMKMYTMTDLSFEVDGNTFSGIKSLPKVIIQARRAYEERQYIKSIRFGYAYGMPYDGITSTTDAVIDGSTWIADWDLNTGKNKRIK